MIMISLGDKNWKFICFLWFRVSRTFIYQCEYKSVVNKNLSKVRREKNNNQDNFFYSHNQNFLVNEVLF